MLIPNLDFGGAQRVFYDQGSVLAQKYEIVECVFNLEFGHAFPSGNRVVSLGVPAGITTFGKAFRFIQRCWRFYWLKKKEKPIITISHLEGADYVNILSFGKDKKVLVVHGSKVYDQEIDNSFGWLRRNVLLPFLYKRANLIVTVSGGIRNELIQHFKISLNKVLTLYNSFNLERLKVLANEPTNLPLNIRSRGLKLITSGRLAEQKNQIPLLGILKSLKEEHYQPVQLFFAGDGPLKSKLKSVANSLLLSCVEIADIDEKTDADIVFLGYQVNPFRLYKEMDLFLFPSAWEGFPMALGEAMALGIPVISSNCPTGPLELLEPDWEKKCDGMEYPLFTANGVLLPVPNIEKPETIKMWKDTILQVIRNDDIRRGMAESAQIRMRAFDGDVLQDKWLDIDKAL